MSILTFGSVLNKVELESVLEQGTQKVVSTETGSILHVYRTVASLYPRGTLSRNPGLIILVSSKNKYY
jgi:hypothetical protein